MSRSGPRPRVLPAVLSFLAACSADLSTPEGTARAFADRYYVELDLPRAAELCQGAARARVEQEVALAGAARGGRSAPAPPQAARPRVWYELAAVEVAGDRAVVALTLRIQPEAGGAFERTAMLTLARTSGQWRLVDIAESSSPR